MDAPNLFSPLLERSAREKNLIALLILAAGLIVGSLFIDVVQLFTGAGFSGRAIREHNLLEAGGKTWVAYTDPKVTLRVVSDEECLACNPDEALLWLRRIVPTVEAVQVEADSFEGQKLIEAHALRTIPSFIFDASIEKTDFFAEAAPLFVEKDGQYLFDMNKIGLPVGKYLVAPAITADDIQLGTPGASVAFTVFSDFQCQYCKQYHAEYRKVLEAYGDRITFAFKHFPLPSHPQAETAAQAAQCAALQGKFLEYGDLLFETQKAWGDSQGTTAFKNLARRVRGFNERDFATCLDSGKYAEKVLADMQAAADYGLVSAPTTFIGTELIDGAATFDDLKPILDRVLDQAAH